MEHTKENSEEWNKFIAYNTKRVDGLERHVAHHEALGKLSEVKELLIACQDALRYEDSWSAKDLQTLITKALNLCGEK